MGVWGQLGLYRVYMGCPGSVWNCMGHLGVIWGHRGQMGLYRVYTGHAGGIWSCIGAHGAPWEYMGSYGASWDSMGAQRASWGCMGGVWGILGVYGGTGVKLRLYRVYMGHGGGMYSCVEHPGAVQRVLMYNLDVHVASWGCTEHIQCILHVYQASLGCIEGI